MKTYLKKIKILEDRKVELIYKEENKILVIKKGVDSKYILIPRFLTLRKEANILISESMTSDREELEKYLWTNILIETCIRKIGSSYKKKLTLKGLGYRMTLFPDLKRVDFKLGYSHLKKLEIPNQMKIKIRKNSINVESENKGLLGNFVSKIHSLRRPDSYKGKGFWYKYEKEKLKEIKKK